MKQLFENKNVHDYLNDLNKAQRDAVENYDGASLVIAGAGSGKTRVLTYRIAHLLKLGAKPWSILALTFTNKAAREMKDRISSIMGPNVSKYIWMGTFHSTFSRILRAEHEAIGYTSNFTIYDATDSKSLIRTIIKDMKLDDKTYKPNVVSSRISGAKNNLITPAAYGNFPELYEYDQSIRMPFIGQIYKEYAKRCFLAGAMDFDDLLMKTNMLFHNHPAILEKYQKQFDYILVDEYQDTNHAQYLIIKRLAEKHHNICVVGDDAQSIYSFRGARIENIFNFQKDYPEHHVFKLEQNYRSTQNIVNAANSIIAKNKRQIAKKVYSEKEKGSLIKVSSALTDNEEGFIVASQIGESRMLDHYRYEDFAILYRTNAQSRIFEEALRKRNIPYKIFGGLSFYQRKEIKDILSYFRLAVNLKDNEAFKRIVNYPARGIGDTTLSKLEQTSSQLECSIWEVAVDRVQENPAGLNRGTLEKIGQFAGLINMFREKLETGDAYEVATEIATGTGIMKDLYNDQSPEGVSRFENIQELLNGIQEFTIAAKEEGRPSMLANYMEDVSLLTDQDSEKPEDIDKVSLMTVHMAKGLEFKNVFVVGLEENLFPSNQSGNKTAEEMEEERRLFYVAVTRAEDRAYLSYARQRYKWGKLEFCNPSRFIEEIDPNYLDKPKEKELSFFDDKPEVTFKWGQRTVQTSTSRTVQKPITNPFELSEKLQKLRDVKKETGPFDGSPPSEIQAGMTIEHQRFGRGKVLQVEGQAPNLKATVFFQEVGQKQLLLKFAKLKIVK